MRFPQILIGLPILALPLITAQSMSQYLLESLPEIPHGWTQESAPDTAKLLKLWIAVRQQCAMESEQKHVDLSTPGHELYGKHMSREDVKDFLKPASNVSEAILS
jgi:tripeptidyl-peptidase-1